MATTSVSSAMAVIRR
jgi:hypothetical protein